jgi:GNAT superfamily N-acetyltransferase
MNFTIRRVSVDDTAALEAFTGIRNAVTPDNTTSPDELRWEQTTYPGQVELFLAESGGGVAVGAASTGRIFMYPEEYERYWLGIWVLPEARRQGIGTELLVAVSGSARTAGKTGFETELSVAYPDGHRFLADRGFVVTERNKMVRLELAGLAAPEVRAPDGIRIVTLAERPDLLTGVHAVAVEAFPDIPSAGEPMDPGTLEEFVARDVERAGIRKDAFAIAVHEASGEVVGYASLSFAAGSTALAYHDMTAVRRVYRGRGIAGALKRSTIAWAVAHRLEALDTGNDEDNAPMRAVNAALGYRPVPDWLGLQGPLATQG